MSDDTETLTTVQRETRIGAILGGLLDASIALHRVAATGHDRDDCKYELQHQAAMDALARHSGKLSAWDGLELVAAGELLFILNQASGHVLDHMRETMGVKAIEAFIDLLGGHDE